MKYMTIVVTIFAVHTEVLYCSWALFSKELDMNVSQSCMDNGTVIQMLNTCMWKNKDNTDFTLMKLL